MLMKRKAKEYVLFASLLCMWACLTGCKSIIEEDIDDKKVTINAPNTSVLENYNQLFWWELLEGATKYQVQIASPSFGAMQELTLDTTITSNKLLYTLGSGDYEWRIRALNGNYKTAYAGSTFTILEADLNTQYILLNTPGDGWATKNRPVTISWIKLNVTGITYQAQVSDASSFTNTTILNKQTTSLSASAPIPATEATYYWRVRAFKGQDTTLWSDIRSFIYDVTPPSKVTLSLPADNSEVTNAASGKLTWTAVTGSNIKYKVYLKVGSAEETQFTVTTNSASYNGAPGETVTWKVQAIDAAENVGEVSATWSFLIKS